MRFEAGDEWWLTDAAVIAEANRAAMERTDEDVWASDIDGYLAGRTQVRVEDILGHLGIEKGKRGMNEQKRVGSHLHRRGWVRDVKWLDGQATRVWVRRDDPA